MVYLAIVAAVCGAEALIRRWVRKNLLEDEIREASGVPVRLHRFHNRGMAGSRMQEHPGLVRALGLLSVALLALTFFLILPVKGRKGLKTGLALVLGGGLANVSERFYHGHVTDYIQFPTAVPRIRRLIFNVADFCIFLGGILMVLSEIRGRK